MRRWPRISSAVPLTSEQRSQCRSASAASSTRRMEFSAWSRAWSALRCAAEVQGCAARCAGFSGSGMLSLDTDALRSAAADCSSSEAEEWPRRSRDVAMVDMERHGGVQLGQAGPGPGVDGSIPEGGCRGSFTPGCSPPDQDIDEGDVAGPAEAARGWRNEE